MSAGGSGGIARGVGRAGRVPFTPPGPKPSPPLLLQEFDFSVTQARYVKAAMDQIPSFRPDGLSPAEAGALVASAASPRVAYVAAKAGIDLARATRRVSVEALHDACVDATAQMRSRFRRVATASQLIARLPTEDQTVVQTISRGDSIAALWPNLPLVGSPAVVFSFGQGTATVGLAGFTALRDGARAADAAIPGIDQTFQEAEANVHAKHAEVDDFVQAALSQGASQFEEGTPEREIIDAVPNAPAQHLPDAATISVAALTGTPGVVRLEYNANGATSYDVRMRQAGAVEWTLVAEDTLETELETEPLGLTQSYEFQVVGRNSRGAGAPSDVVTLMVP